jgi:4-amino-4-deoxy-L-arabinose transferase-like glycosyltransferase
LLARRLYFVSVPGIPEWRRHLAEVNLLPRFEPPLMEHATALAYRLRGGEDLRIPRLLSIVAWLMGGGFVYWLGRRVAGAAGALVSAAFFLLSPFTVEASRSFQPDPLMVALLAGAFLGLHNYGERLRLGPLLLAAVVGGLAILVKPMAVFQVVSAFAAVVLFRRRQLGRRWLVHAPLFLLAIAMIAAPYYYAQRGGLQFVAEQSFIPHLLASQAFWIGWVGQVWKTCGLVPPALAALGAWRARDGLARAMLAGMAAGYVAFVISFNYQTSTHDYYHLQLYPLVAVGLAPLVDRAATIVRSSSARPRLVATVASGVFALACLDTALTARSRIRSRDFARELGIYREVGERIGHGPSNVLLADHYAYPLKYHGELGGVEWPRWYDFQLANLMGGSPLGAAERLKPILEGHQPRFFVITVPGDLAGQPDLAALLQRSYPLEAAGDGYLIYRLR